MKKIKNSLAYIILFSVIATLFIIVLTFYNKTSRLITNLNKSSSNLEYTMNYQNSKETKSNIEVVDKTWNKYINYDLGFEINYPKSTGFGPVEIKESGDVVYIISSDLEKEEIKERENMGDFDKVKGIPYAILIKEVENTDELKQFVKNRYGENCTLGEITLNKEDDLHSVKVFSTDVINSTEPGACIMNFVYKIVYDRENGKVAAWDMGQAVNFMEGENVYDNEINRSFKFKD
ncbi:MAG: hypothetical protein PF488_00300 [Patescibacteria group bacterium]|jgi:hypothetical protein|nr:hypothetical protein [Patescibacteria group bacterium]